MASDPKKITELDEATSIASTSWFVLADTAVTTMSASGTDFKVSKANLTKGLLPSQSGQAGKVLSTNGTSLSWAVDATGGGSLPADVAYTDVANTFTVSPQTIVADTDGHKGLIVKAHSGTQSASLQEWQDSTGTAKTLVDAGGHLLSHVHAAVGNRSSIDQVYDPIDFTAVGSAALLIDDEIVTFVGGQSGGVVSHVALNPATNINTRAYGYLSNIDTGLGPNNPGFTTPNTHNFSGDYAACNFGFNHYGTGTVSSAAGVEGYVSNLAGGVISGAYGAYLNVLQQGSSGSIGTAYGCYVDATYAQVGTTVGTAYGLYLGDQSPDGGSPGVAAHYNLYSGGATTHNTFEGALLVGAAATNNAAAVLQADSTTKGFLPPRMTTTQRDAIASPPEGLVLFNTTTHKLTYRNNSTWIEV